MYRSVRPTFSWRKSGFSWRKSGVWLGLIAMAVAWRGSVSTAELAGPGAQDRAIAKVVSTLISSEHLTAQPLDDKMADRAFHGFLKQLDPMKFYFLQSDVDEFAKRRSTLDDLIRNGDIRFAFEVFRRFSQRMDERLVDIEQLLQSPQDFTADEQMVSDADQRHYAKTAEEARDFWRQRIKFDLLRLKVEDEDEAKEAAAKKAATEEEKSTTPPVGQEEEQPSNAAENVPESTDTPAPAKKADEAPTDRLRRRYRSFVERMHQIDSDELLEMYLTAFTTGFDPHTTYMSRDTLDDFRISMSLQLEGIGAALEMEDGLTKVANVIPGGAAEKTGQIKSEDRIVSVGQGPDGAMEEVVDLKLRDVVKKIRGPAGTIVRLGVMHAGEQETKIVSIKRERIALEDSAAQSVIIEHGTKGDGTPYRIGVIDLPSFYMDMEAAKNGSQDFKSTTRDVKELLHKFTQQKVDAVVLNLRRNGGGSLTEAIDLTGLFIDRGPVVQVKNSNGTIRPYDDPAPGMAWSGPLVVLTSKFSASASEILAGAVQDYSRGIIVGDKATHGKGTVQSLLDLGDHMFPGISKRPNLGALKITIQQFYRPSGDSTQKRGVLADVPLPSVTSQMDVGEQDLEYAVEFDHVRNARFNRYNMVAPEIVRELAARSETRRAASDEFAKLNRDIERYRMQKDRKFVTLNEEKFLQERAELDAERSDEKQFKEQQVKGDEIFEKNFYNNEVLDVTVDYLEMLKSGNIAVATTVPASQP